MCLTCGCGREADQHGDSRHITLLDLQGAATAAGISVTEAAQNLMRCLDAGAVEKSVPDALTKLLKAGAYDEQRYTLLLAWPAMKPDVGIASDGKRDFLRPETVERAAWDYMRKSRRVGISPLGPITNHMAGPEVEGHGEVVESYVYRGPDWEIPAADALIKAGDWLCGVVWDEQAWGLWKAGIMNGASPFGRAQRGTPKAADLAQLRR